MQVYQNLVDEDIPPIEAFKLRASSFTSDSDAYRQLTEPLRFPSVGSLCVGLAGGYNNKGRLSWLALARGETVVLLEIGGSARSDGKVPWAQLLEESILMDERTFLLGFDLAPLALALWRECKILVANGVDVPSAVIRSVGEADTKAAQSVKESRRAYNHIRYIIDDDTMVYEDNVDATFTSETIDSGKEKDGLIALTKRAWIAHFISTLSSMEPMVYDNIKVNTHLKSSHELDVLAKQSLDTYRLTAEKPTLTRHEAMLTYDNQFRQVNAKSLRFQNRLRGGGPGQKVRIEASSARGTFSFDSQTGRPRGQFSNVETPINLTGITTTSITTIGREGPTRAEARKTTTILNALHGESAVAASPWYHAIFRGEADIKFPAADHITPPPLIIDENKPLNLSQRQAAEAMLDRSANNVTLIQGPPGTGKTSVIAAYVLSAVAGGQKGIWLVAQSNVAVKNIAEKLLKVDFHQWLLLVSNDFVEGWHDHLYTQIKEHTIYSHMFGMAKKKLQTSKCCVILCTLSMLSNPKLFQFTNVIPIKTLVVDEASQINVGDYLSVIDSQKSLLKFAFIGDDKQLPPFGNDEIKSIFEVDEIRSKAFFLDTQYRMPSSIGDFISQSMYDNKLKSWEDHPIKPHIPSCFFINVASGKGLTQGTSQYNNAELDAVKKITLKLIGDGKEVCVITPYDAQRSNIEKQFRQEGIGAEVHNVDSYQGNEQDYIVISLVRHQELGFLKDFRRTNVMLTRCRHGMYICTSRRYLLRDGKTSLVGQLAEHVGEQAWLEMEDIESGSF